MYKDLLQLKALYLLQTFQESADNVVLFVFLE